MARARAENALADDAVQVQTITTDIQSRIADGSLPWDKASDEFQDRVGQLDSPKPSDLDAPDVERFTGRLRRNRMESEAVVSNLALSGKRAEMKGQVSSLRDRLAKLASDPNADLGKIVAGGEGLRDLAAAGGVAANFDKDQRDFSDRVYSDNAKARLISGHDDLDALTQLEQDLTSDDGRYAGKLDADKTNALLSQVVTAKSRLEAKAAHEADRGEAAADRTLTQFRQQVATGVSAPLDTVNTWTETMRRGTPEQQAEFKDLLRGEAELQAVLNQPPDVQRAYLQTLQARVTREGATVGEQANLKRMEGAVESNLRALRQEPLVFNANRTGIETQPLDLQSLMDGDVSKVQAQIQARMVTLQTLRKQYGSEAGSAPLLPQEASALASRLTKMDTRGAAKLFGTLNRTIGDPDAYQAAIQQLAPDSPVRALAGRYYALQRANGVPDGAVTSTSVKGEFGDVAMYLLKGEALLNPTKTAQGEDGKDAAFPMPPAQKLSQIVAATVAQAFAGRPQEFETAVQAIRAYYAARSAEVGDVKGTLNNTRLALSVRAVVGEKARFEGRDVIAPWGMSEAEFRDKADEYVQARLKSAKREDPGDVTLLNARGRPDVYLLVRGIEPLYDQKGVPLAFRMRGVQ
ncbi:MAG TPA: hypothetical protein VIT62_06555 [Lysobacter sp.]